MNTIEISNLTKIFKDKVAVNNISLEVKEGELFSLLGVNGAGKTTTIKILSCSILPTSGNVRIYGFDIEKDEKEVKKIINISPQETAVAPNLTVKENLEFICGIYEIDKKEASKIVKELLNKFKLNDIQNKRAKYLSGGYQRRLSIAFSLVNNPKVLYLDEPTLGLDVIARRELWKIIIDLKKTTTILLTTHYMEEAQMLSDRVAIMVNGNIIDIDTPNNIIDKTKSKDFEEAFIKLVEGSNEN